MTNFERFFGEILPGEKREKREKRDKREKRERRKGGEGGEVTRRKETKEPGTLICHQLLAETNSVTSANECLCTCFWGNSPVKRTEKWKRRGEKGRERKGTYFGVPGFFSLLYNLHFSPPFLSFSPPFSPFYLFSSLPGNQFS